MEHDKTTPENGNARDEKNVSSEISSKQDGKNADPVETEELSKREKEESPKRGKKASSGKKKEASPRPEPREPRERLSPVGWIACFWPLGVVPPLGVFLWLHYFVITARDGFLSYVPRLTAVIVAFLLNSLLTIWFYKEDKRLAERHRRRIPEFYLHFWELICGWPGALYAQKKYHHKWRKLTYMFVFWVYIVLNVLIVFCVLFPGVSESIVRGIVTQRNATTEEKR